MLFNVYIYYSFWYGILLLFVLIECVVQLGYIVMVFMDINNISCLYEFVCCCEKVGIKFVLGLEFCKEGCCLYIGLACNWEGFCEFNQFLSEVLIEGWLLFEVVLFMQYVYIIYFCFVKFIQVFWEEEFLGVCLEYVVWFFGYELLQYKNKLVAFSLVFFVDNEGFEFYCLLWVIDENILLNKLMFR